MKKKILILSIAIVAVAAVGLGAFGIAGAAGLDLPALAGPQSDALGVLEHGGDSPLRPYIEEASAGILGITVEELQTALDEGTTVSELLETAGLTHLEFRMALDEATPGIVRAALADEAITQEQADRILEYGLPFGRGCGGRHGGNGGPGGSGGFGPGGPQGSGPGFPGGDVLSGNG